MADDDDDPQLRPLRAAWRAMPDEDPPERGLAELMAAARQQAEVMTAARVPWWKKLASALLRPPMLALASVLILLGGLFVVTSSNKGVSPEPSPIEHDEAPAAPAAIDRGQAAGSASTGAPSTAELRQEQAPAEVPAVPRPTRRTPPAHHIAVPVPKPTPRTLEDDRPAPPPPAKAAAMPPAAAAFDSDERGAPSAVQKKRVVDVVPATPRQQLDDQLLAQCRAAAQRGDCEVAEQLAKRIERDDPPYYEAHVTGDATIAPCLK